MEHKKQAYQAPQLVEYGSVSDLTKEAGLVNADVPQGPPNSAYSPGS